MCENKKIKAKTPSRITLNLTKVFIVLHWFLLESGRIQAIPEIPEESNLEEGLAKLIKWFQWNFKWNWNSGRMVPGITWKEWYLECTRMKSGSFTTTLTMPSHAQINHWCLLTKPFGHGQQPQTLLSLTTTIIHNAHPVLLPPHRHQCPQPPPIVACHPQWPQHTPTPQEQDKNFVTQ